jgi:hypothetical protein
MNSQQIQPSLAGRYLWSVTVVFATIAIIHTQVSVLSAAITAGFAQLLTKIAAENSSAAHDVYRPSSPLRAQSDQKVLPDSDTRKGISE